MLESIGVSLYFTCALSLDSDSDFMVACNGDWQFRRLLNIRSIMQLNIHDVSSISMEKPERLGGLGGTLVSDLVIKTEKGEKLCITLFGEQKEFFKILKQPNFRV